MIYSFKQWIPEIHSSVFVAPDATIIGDVKILENSSIWFNAVLRGDIDCIRIGKNTSVQDNTVIHVTGGKYPVHVHDNVIVAHGVMLHGCTIHDYAMIGIGAKVLDNAVIGRHSIVAAGSTVLPGTEIPDGVLAAGSPAKIKRELSEKDFENHSRILNNYDRVRKEYLSGDFQQIR